LVTFIPFWQPYSISHF